VSPRLSLLAFHTSAGSGEQNLQGKKAKGVKMKALVKTSYAPSGKQVILSV
jgi:hypothetical protein